MPKIKVLICNFLILLIRLYKLLISPILGKNCRYYPSCSDYAIDAIRKYGPVKGLLMSIHRILKCNPLSKGGYDPVK
ncbi:MAG: membrane protein insertion efficiency factor YidD [Thermosulfidibacteraceae bacterium]